MTRHENKGPTPDDSVYLTINEATQLHRQGLTFAEIADVMDMDESEVQEMINDHFGYERRRGLPTKGICHSSPLPLPSEIAAECAAIQRWNEVAMKDATQTPPHYEDNYEPRVVPRPKFTRRGF